MKTPRPGQEGFTIVGILVSIAVTMIVSFSISQLIIDLYKTRGLYEFRAQVNTEYELMRLAFLSEEFCDTNLLNKGPTPTGLEIDKLVSPTGAVFAQKTGGAGFRLSNIKLYSGQKLDDNIYLGKIEMTYEKGQSQNGKPSPFIRNRSLTLGYELDPSGKILACRLGLHPEE